MGQAPPPAPHRCLAARPAPVLPSSALARALAVLAASLPLFSTLPGAESTQTLQCCCFSCLLQHNLISFFPNVG